MDRRRRVAVTLEQCWHRVPGGTATSILETVAALKERPDLEVVGVAARHAEPPPAPFQPAVTVSHLPLPRLALYETWHALRWPPVERATGPVDVVHATAVAVPPTRAPLVMTIHDLAFLADPSLVTRHGNRFFRRGTELARRHARLVLVPSE
ncbi:MAG: glycosyltransferase family 4 protein, partial [Acidimicrobiales bacterium]|nr:glycosyltransferase family 4 protein [Acidimicrobiales bacterium]